MEVLYFVICCATSSSEFHRLLLCLLREWKKRESFFHKCFENKTKTFHRTNSFCQAVLSGHKENQIIEHVSTKRDSFINEKDGWSSPTFSTLEFIMPSKTNQIDFDQQNNIYQIILPSTPIITHTV